jgi:hypothetical protein
MDNVQKTLLQIITLVILLKYRKWTTSKKRYYRLLCFSNIIKIQTMDNVQKNAIKNYNSLVILLKYRRWTMSKKSYYRI